MGIVFCEWIYTYSFKNISSDLYLKTRRKENWNFLCPSFSTLSISNINLNVIHFCLFLESRNFKNSAFKFPLQISRS